jgi:hypothetical protein
MATPYNEVYDSFLSKITEYSFLKLTQEELETQLFKYLKSAIVSFSKPKIDLKDRDDLFGQFNNDLNDDEIELLATWMIYHFIRPKVVSSENYRQIMSDSDFKIYSQRNHLDGLIRLEEKLKKDAQMMNTQYSYKDRNLSNMKGDESS